MVSYGYLWNEVRVKGGAYGTGIGINSRGMISTYSYRDPSPLQSIATNKGIGDFIRQFCESGQKPDSFILSSIADMEPLVSPASRGDMADSDWLSGVTYEDKKKERRQMIATSTEDLISFAELADRFADTAPVCVVAGSGTFSGTEDLELIEI